MKSTQVNKLYGKLSPYEQAALCFEAAVRNDSADVEAIKSAVEWANYHCPHYDFRRRSFGLFLLGGYYGAEYWKSYSLMLVALMQAETEVTAHKAELVFQHAGNLAAMDEALNITCKKLNVDVEAVRKMAGCQGHQKQLKEVANHGELVIQYCECLEAFANY